MSNVVACSCGKKLRLPEGTAAKAVRCPGCQSVVRLDGAIAAAPPAPPAHAGGSPPPKAVATAPIPAPPTKPAPPKPPAGKRLIEDPPNVWLYVTDPALIAKVEADGGRQTSLRTYGPNDDPLAELGVPGADDIRAYLGKQEYVAWVGRPSDKHAGDAKLMAYVSGSALALIGLMVAAVGLIAPVPLVLKVVLPIFGLLFGGVGVGVVVLVARGMRVTSGISGHPDAHYLLTNRRAIVWVSKAVVRSFTGPMVMGLRREVKPEYEDEDFGSVVFTHGLDDNPAGRGFCDVEKVSEVEDLVRGYLIDRVLEKSAAGDGPRLVPREGPNPFAKDDKGGAKKPAKKLELWQAAALAMELEKPLTPEMIAAAKAHTDLVLGGAELTDAEAAKVRDELQPGETPVWVGKPNPAAAATLAWLMAGGLIAFSVAVVIAMTVLYFVFAKEMGGGPFWTGLTVMGVLAAAGVVGGLCYPTYAKWRAAFTFYVLTSRRALVWAADWMGTPQLEAYGPRDLSNLHVAGNDVVFRTVTTVYESRKSGTHATTARYGFVAIDDAPAVEKLVRETLVDPFLEKAYE